MEIPKNVGVSLWDIEKIIPYEKNAKIHTPEQVEQIKGWILRSGWTQPIVVQKSTGSIIAGHGRRLAALSIGLKKVPVIAIDISDAETKAARLADNAIVSKDYDVAAIQAEIFELKDLGIDLDTLGFSIKELDFLNETVVDFNESAFVDDITEAVESQKTENTRKQAETDMQETPLSKSFGFKRLTIGQGRKIKTFMAFVELETGKAGAEALMIYIDGLGL